MKRSGILSGGTYADPRLLKVQVERAAKAIRGTIRLRLLGGIFRRHDQRPGAVSREASDRQCDRSCRDCFPYSSICLGGFEVVRAQPRTPSDPRIRRWLRRLLCVSVILSAAWGCAPWLCVG
jgi:hypothetical protein